MLADFFEIENQKVGTSLIFFCSTKFKVQKALDSKQLKFFKKRIEVIYLM